MADGVLEGLVTRLLRVPARPHPPSGSPGSLRVFNPARGFYRYRLVAWILKQLGTVTGLVVGLVALRTVTIEVPFVGAHLIDVIELVGIVSFVAQLPVTFVMIGLDYRYRWYMVSDTSLRIREGLWRVREQTMTHANIQNLAIRQGPLQRLFGISDLRVRTAGGGHRSGDSEQEGSEAANMHLGYLRGVDNPAEIRDLMLDRMRRQRDSGLGDPDEPADHGGTRHAAAAAGSSQLLDAAHDLLAEARRLRRALQ